MLKYRVITAVVLLLIIFAMMWLLKPPIFAAVISIFFIISAKEWAGLMGLKSLWQQIVYAGLVIVLLFAAYFSPGMPIFCAALAVWIWAAISLFSYQQKGYLLGFHNPWVKGLCGLLLLTACWKGATLLQAASPLWLLWVFGLIWLTDTGAFFAGRRWGQHALASQISPKKTWEGFWGGILLAVAVLGVCSLFLPISVEQRALLLLLVMICALFAVIGDLFVSLLKRQAGLKDTGSLLPGHGGLLDRVDSTISAVPIFALGFLLLKLG